MSEPNANQSLISIGKELLTFNAPLCSVAGEQRSASVGAKPRPSSARSSSSTTPTMASNRHSSRTSSEDEASSSSSRRFSRPRSAQHQRPDPSNFKLNLQGLGGGPAEKQQQAGGRAS